MGKTAGISGVTMDKLVSLCKRRGFVLDRKSVV